MKVNILHWHSVASWQWNVGKPKSDDDDDDEPGEDGDELDDLCGICRVPYDGCCPACKVPGDDCPLIWGECTHVFHLHCLKKWHDASPPSKQQCPMDRRIWVTATQNPQLEPAQAPAAPAAQGSGSANAPAPVNAPATR